MLQVVSDLFRSTTIGFIDCLRHCRRNAASRTKEVQRNAAIGRAVTGRRVGGVESLLKPRARDIARTRFNTAAFTICTVDVETDIIGQCVFCTHAIVEHLRDIFTDARPEFDRTTINGRQWDGGVRVARRTQCNTIERAELIADGRVQKGVVTWNEDGTMEISFRTYNSPDWGNFDQKELNGLQPIEFEYEEVED